MPPRIYFAGVNQHNFCETFRGFHVLESFADVRSLLDRYRPLFASMILDSGAFSAMNSGRTIVLEEYAEFALKHRAAYNWCASLDSIDGGVDANLANWSRLHALGLKTVPTFHQGEPWELLKAYLGVTDRIGLGFQRPIVNAREWLTECFTHIPAGFKVHGWAMTNYTDLPFYSVDSTSWLFDMKGLLSVKGNTQGMDALACLTQREILEIIQKKYERGPRRQAAGFGEVSEG